MPHVLHKCDDPECFVCTGGLGLCTICGGTECSMATDCPGARITAEQADAICAGDLDYRDGAWMALPSCPKCHDGGWVSDGSELHICDCSAGHLATMFKAAIIHLEETGG